MKHNRAVSLLLFVFAFLSAAVYAGGPDKLPKPRSLSPWTLYMGLSVGTYNANFLYNARYFNNSFTTAPSTPSTLAFAYTSTQSGVLGGFQFGFQYHLSSPYFVGAVLSGMAPSNKGEVARHVIGATSSGNPFDIQNEFRIFYNFNLAGLIGTDITQHTHFFLKAGGSFARASVRSNMLLSTPSMNPTPVLRLDQFVNLWGWVFGLGITHDINKWLSAFAEYDYFDYPSRSLNAIDNPAPSSPASEQLAVLNQGITTSAHSVMVGLNFKFKDGFIPFKSLSDQAWMLYIGGFGGNYSADFDYDGVFFVNIAGVSGLQNSNIVFNNEAAQKGASVGGQIGIQYHLKSPGFFGLVFDGMINSEKARLTNFSQNTTTGSLTSIDMNHEFSIVYSLGVAALIGADITPHTHIYFKAGASNAQLKDHFFITVGRIAFYNNPFFVQTHHKNIWGWLAGLGLTQDITKWINVFAEYDYYDYGHHSLPAFTNFDPNLFIFNTGARDHLAQSVSVTVNTVRLGFNFKFMDNYVNSHYLAQTPPSLFYVGAFGGYYDANYQLGGAYFSIRTGFLTANYHMFAGDVLQQGASIGAQIGYQYHFRNPYFLGLVFDTKMNAGKANLVENVENGIAASAITTDLNYRLRIAYNFDIAAIIGADLTQKTHMYFKAGASCARTSVNFFTTPGDFYSTPTVFFENTQKDYYWGWLFGLGLKRDISKRVTAFVEYTYNDYPPNNLEAFDGVAAGFDTTAAAGQVDRIVHHLSITSNAVVLGVNVNLNV